jgi:type IV pilus assembly protein PilA
VTVQGSGRTFSRSHLQSNMKRTTSTHSHGFGTHGARGMTLVEVMIVVVIVGILSSLAVYGVSRYIRASQASEAGAIINAIKGAQEVYRQDTFRYLPVSTSFADNYPAATPQPAGKIQWGAASPVGNNFKQLGVRVDAATYFVFSCVVADAGADMPDPPTAKVDFGINADDLLVEQRFMVVATADLDGDGSDFSYALSHNLTNEVYTENSGE